MQSYFIVWAFIESTRKGRFFHARVILFLFSPQELETCQQVLFWSRGSLSRVLEGTSFSFKCIDPRLTFDG
nr:hypothetical protein CFP56_63297 [Quercus suber]